MVWGREKVRLKQQRKASEIKKKCWFVVSCPQDHCCHFERVTLPENCNKIVQGGENWETNLFSLRVKQDYLS